MVDPARAARARRRAAWPGELLAHPTPAQLETPALRLGTMWQLALDTFGADAAHARGPRADWPGRLVRGG